MYCLCCIGGDDLLVGMLAQDIENSATVAITREADRKPALGGIFHVLTLYIVHVKFLRKKKWPLSHKL